MMPASFMKPKEPKGAQDEVGLTWDNCEGVIAQKANRMGWALCVGAGASRDLTEGVFPDWPALVKRLMRKDTVVSEAKNLHESLTAFGPDALIEAAKDRLRLSDEAFVQRLRELLYADLQTKAGAQWEEIAKCLTAASPAQQKRAQWEKFRTFFATNYDGLCSLQLAKVIARTSGTVLEPAAVVSFNAEPLLYALINAERALSQGDEKVPKDLRMFNRVTRGISYQEAARLPYIFCHGLLEVDAGYKIFAETAASTEKLVFSEASYLRLANSAFSWQSAVFLGTAVLRSMVFVGVSFTDPNLRRWLGSVHAERAAELRIKGNENPSYEHYWLTRDSKDESIKRWTESLVRHLGVRVVWMPKYDQVERYLSRMLSLDK
jgi:hypothetical protein